MPNVIYDNLDQLPEGNAEARLALAGYDYAVIDLDITSETGAGIRANETKYILTGKNRTITGQTYGLDLTGHASSITNEGSIRSLSETGAGIRLTGTGTYSILNSGTITAAGLAIQGSVGTDRIINTGTLGTTGNSILLDLGTGNDFYDGALGHATGGVIKLGIGNDTAFGGVDAETFSGGADDDFLVGGGGNDTVDYSDATGRVTVDLNKTAGQTIGGGQGTDTLIDIENVIGGTGNDVIIGNSIQNLLQGGDGHDELSGGSGADTLEGGDGNDMLDGGQGNDMLEGGDGNDMLDGGQGNDMLEGGDGINTARYTGFSGAKVDLRIAAAQDTVSYGRDILRDIVNLEGGSSADHFIGNDADNRLVGNGGANTLEGGAGNDTLIGGTSNRNTAVFSGASSEYDRVKNSDGTFTITHARGTKADGVDTLKDVRVLEFLGDSKTIALTNQKPTTLYLPGTSVSEDKKVGFSLGYLYSNDPEGDALTYSLTSNPGNLFGVRDGQSGPEVYLKRTLDYEKTTQHKITLMVQDTYGASYSKSYIINVQNVVEKTSLVRTGTSKSDQLTGESGNDKLSGKSGSDNLFGNIGNDTLIGGNGSDNLFGGAGKDTFVFDYKPNVKTNFDYIKDFSPKDDVIHLSQKVFSKIAKGALSSKAFVVGDHFKDKDDRILYYKQGGGLFYDPDGNGSAKAIQFAGVAKNLAITYKDFYII